MKVNTKIYAGALYEALKGAKPAECDSVILNFVKLLAANNLLSYQDKIIEDFSRIYNEAEGILEVSAQTAFALSAAEAKKISEAVEQLTGKKVNLTQGIEPALLGGLKLKIEDTLIDDSLQTRISRLGDKMIYG